MVLSTFLLMTAEVLLQPLMDPSRLKQMKNGVDLLTLVLSQVTISGFDLTSYRDCLTKWSSAVETMFSQCQTAGETRCLPVYYEQLVLYPEKEMRKLLNFLELQWDPSVLHHEELIGKAGGVSLSK